MSAYVVDREVILYLVEAAVSVIGPWHRLRPAPYLDWYWDRDLTGCLTRRGELRADSSPEQLRAVAQMLWDENVRAVAHRYPDAALGGPYEISLEDVSSQHWAEPFDAVQVIKTCQCYKYQCVEDPDFHETEACAFIRALQAKAIEGLPGMEEAEWGAPEPTWPLTKEAVK